MESGVQILNRRRMIAVNGLLLILLMLTLIATTLIGAVPIGIRELLGSAYESDPAWDIILRARLPRVLLAVIVGGGLASSGLILQGLLQNPLACAQILGVSGGASLGGICGLMLIPQSFLLSTNPLLRELSWIPVFSFIGALLSILLIHRFSTIHGKLHPYHLLLAGVIFNAFAGAVILFLNSILDFYQAQNLLFWLMGNLSTRSYVAVGFTWFYVLMGFLWKWHHGHALNLLSLGEENAQQLGVDVNRLQKHLFVAASLIVGVIVSISGMIGFVGLMVPHVMRLMLGSDFRLLLPASFLAGGIFLCWADTLARVVLAPVELPVGVITAFLGGPFFFYLLYREARNPSHETGV
jgi:iron complex transport system permease protein